MDDIPPRFEDEYPKQAAYLMERVKKIRHQWIFVIHDGPCFKVNYTKVTEVNNLL